MRAQHSSQPNGGHRTTPGARACGPRGGSCSTANTGPRSSVRYSDRRESRADVSRAVSGARSVITTSIGDRDASDEVQCRQRRRDRPVRRPQPASGRCAVRRPAQPKTRRLTARSRERAPAPPCAKRSVSAPSARLASSARCGAGRGEPEPGRRLAVAAGRPPGSRKDCDSNSASSRPRARGLNTTTSCAGGPKRYAHETSTEAGPRSASTSCAHHAAGRQLELANRN